MIVLGIETTCDETAVAIVEDGSKILTNLIHSQATVHQQYGGVFPEVASRLHVHTLPKMIHCALQETCISWKEVGLVAVAQGPGLIGPLLIGINGAKALSLAWQKPFIGVNHVEAHLYAAMMGQEEKIFPSLGVVVSGGHTSMVVIESIGQYRFVGATVDDAIGEAFDKVAKMLHLPYPGGPEIEKWAQQGDAKSYPFQAGKVKERPWDFSFSGLKTNVFYTLYGQNSATVPDLIPSDTVRANVAASFQEIALRDVVDKAIRAKQAFGCRGIYVGGGVSQNRRLRALFAEKMQEVFWPERNLSLDNAAMIAGLGYHNYHRQGKGDGLDMEPKTRIPFY